MRKGNPKGIKDWGDLVKPGVSVITANPKTSGGARWSYLAAWGWALKQPGGDDAKAQDFVARLFANVPVLDSGARGSTVTFAERGIGDVLLAWENEALPVAQGVRRRQVRHRLPADRASWPSRRWRWSTRWSTSAARARWRRPTCEYLYTPEGQEIAAQQLLPPDRRQGGGQVRQAAFRRSSLFTIDEVFGGWAKAQKTHFADGGVFDQIYTKK